MDIRFRVHIYYYFAIRYPKTIIFYGLLGPNSIVVVYMDPLGFVAIP